jgi:hypothetical protein
MGQKSQTPGTTEERQRGQGKKSREFLQIEPCEQRVAGSG